MNSLVVTPDTEIRRWEFRALPRLQRKRRLRGVNPGVQLTDRGIGQVEPGEWKGRHQRFI